MKSKLQIEDDKSFRDFLRKIKVVPFETER